MTAAINIGHIILEDSYTPDKVSIVSKTPANKPIGEGCLQEAEEENRNGRCYLTPDLVREQNCARTQELLKTGYMLGEAGHPTDSSIIRQQTIDPKETAVRYLKFWMEGPQWMAQFTGTNNEYGRAVNDDLLEGYLPAFSMRSLGTLQQIGGRNVVRDLKYITHDFVIFPSHPGAYTRGLVSEACIQAGFKPRSHLENAVFTNRKHKPIAEAKMIPIYNEEIMAYIKQESANVQSIIEQFEVLYESIELNPNRTAVILTTRDGAKFSVNLETYIKNDIEQYCSQFSFGESVEDTGTGIILPESTIVEPRRSKYQRKIEW